MARLLVIGSSNTDMTVHLPELPKPGQTVLGGDLQLGPGGKGANQAVAAARAGASVTFVSAVGDDTFGKRALAAYVSEGLDIAHLKTYAGRPSGVALIFLEDDGDNMIGVAPGANDDLSPEDIDALPEGLFEPGGVLLLAGLEIPWETIARAKERGVSAGMRVLLNPAPAASDLIDEVGLEDIEVITPNRGELSALTGRAADTEDELRRACAKLRKMGSRNVVVTLGAEGCLVESETESLRVPARRVKVEDTVGAGDAFTGALAVALAEGKGLLEAVHWASAASALAITRQGAQAAMPLRGEIDRFAAAPIV
jgi:ribokinase